MRANFLEILTGFLVILLSVGLLIYAYYGTRGRDQQGYSLKIKFERVDGLSEGSDIKMGGIRIGRVASLKLDPEDYSAIATLDINPDVKIPADSSASIISENLLGGKYLSIAPGGDEEMLKPGDEIEHAQSSLILENLIGQLIFSDKDKKDKDQPQNKASEPEAGSVREKNQRASKAA